MPGPIGVHESAANPSSSSARSCGDAGVGGRAELRQRVGAGPASGATRSTRSLELADVVLHVRAGRRARPRIGSGSPRMKRSSAVMCTRLSCTRPARALRSVPSTRSRRATPPSSSIELHTVLEHVDERRRCSALVMRPSCHARPRSRTRSTAWSGPFSRITSLQLAGREDVLLQVHEVDRRPHLAGERVGLRSGVPVEHAEERRVVGAPRRRPGDRTAARTTPRCRRCRRRGTR